MTIEIDLPFTASDVERLRASTGAVVATPHDQEYAEEVATWNVAVPLRPAVAVGASSAADVVHAVRWAAELDLPVGVTTTGHGALPNAGGALLVNTRRLTDVTVDPAARTATVSGGALMRDVNAAAAVHGLAAVQGSSGGVGAAGFTLGGGLGVMSRTFGLAADQLVRVDLVTADGRLRTVDASHDPELFWALAGGKGNLGVVTSLTIRLAELGTFFGGGLFFGGEHARTVLPAYREWADTHTDRTSSSVALLRLPDDPHLPDPIRGRFVVHVRLAHTGSPDEGAAIGNRMRTVAPVLLDTMTVLPITALDAVHLDPPGPLPALDRGRLLTALDDTTIGALLDVAAAPDFPLPIVEVRRLGGEIGRPRANAVPGRGAAYSLTSIAVDAGPGAEYAARVQEELLDTMRPWTHPENLPNLVGRSTDPDEFRAAWPPAMRDRLLAVKRAWDPDNLFSVGPPLVPRHDIPNLRKEQP